MAHLGVDKRFDAEELVARLGLQHLLRRAPAPEPEPRDDPGGPTCEALWTGAGLLFTPTPLGDAASRLIIIPIPQLV